MPTCLIEKYHDYEIEWIEIYSFELDKRERGHGVELYYKDISDKTIIGFIDGFEWFHIKKGLCKVYILSSNSEDLEELAIQYENILNDIKESVYEILQQERLGGKIKGNIYAHANA